MPRIKNLGLIAVALLAGIGVAFATPPARHAARRAAKVDWTRQVARTPAGGVRIGRADAPVALIEYGSRTCPHCARFNEEGVPKLIAGPIATGKLSYEFRDYPVHGAIDLAPILLGHCAVPDQFFPLLDAMMREQAALTAPLNSLTEEEKQQLAKQSPAQIASFLAQRQGYLALAERFGVTPTRAAACLNDPAALAALATQADVAVRDFKLASTPTFVINGSPASEAHDWAALAPLLQAQGAG